MSRMGRLPLPGFKVGGGNWGWALLAEVDKGWGCWEPVEWKDSLELVVWRGWGWDDWEE